MKGQSKPEDLLSAIRELVSRQNTIRIASRARRTNQEELRVCGIDSLGSEILLAGGRVSRPGIDRLPDPAYSTAKSAD